QPPPARRRHRAPAARSHALARGGEARGRASPPRANVAASSFAVTLAVTVGGRTAGILRPPHKEARRWNRPRAASDPKPSPSVCRLCTARRWYGRCRSSTWRASPMPEISRRPRPLATEAALGGARKDNAMYPAIQSPIAAPKPVNPKENAMYAARRSTIASFNQADPVLRLVGTSRGYQEALGAAPASAGAPAP